MEKEKNGERMGLNCGKCRRWREKNGVGCKIKKKGKRPGGKKRSGIDIHTKQEMELGVGDTTGYRIQKRKRWGGNDGPVGMRMKVHSGGGV